MLGPIVYIIWTRGRDLRALGIGRRWSDQTVDVAFNPVGQVVGQFQKVEKSAAVIERWVNEYLEATTHLDELNAAAAG